MITCIAINATTVTVVIEGKNFSEDLDRFKQDVPYEQRHFDGKKWIVRNAHRLSHLKYVQTALKEFKRQPRLI